MIGEAEVIDEPKRVGRSFGKNLNGPGENDLLERTLGDGANCFGDL